jgi:hypothetical protein
MLKLIKDCAPWLNWKVAAVFAALVLCVGLVMGQQLGLVALLGATPLIGLLLCLIPCAIPLLLLKGKGQAKAQPDTSIPLQSNTTCACGSDTCGVGGSANSCKPTTAERA